MNAAYSQTNPSALSNRTTKALLVGGALAGSLFTIAWILAGTLTPHYDPLRHPISALALGEFGWMQVANFFLSGLLLLGFAIGLRRVLRPLGSVWGPLLIGLAGIGLIGAGLFATEPANGYPPNTPIIPTQRSTNGILHDIFGSLFIFGLPIACFVFARIFGKLNERKWVIYSVASGAITFILFFLARFDPELTTLGLRQRIGVTASLIWLTLLAIYILKARKAGSISTQ